MRLSRFHRTSLKDTGGARLTNISNSSITALGSAAEALSRAIGLQRTKQISDARFNDFNLASLRRRESVTAPGREARAKARCWRLGKIEYLKSTIRISSTTQNSITPSLHHSIPANACVNSTPCFAAKSRGYFYSPIAYIVLVFFLLVAGVDFYFQISFMNQRPVTYSVAGGVFQFCLFLVRVCSDFPADHDALVRGGI